MLISEIARKGAGLVDEALTLKNGNDFIQALEILLSLIENGHRDDAEKLLIEIEKMINFEKARNNGNGKRTFKGLLRNFKKSLKNM